MCGGKRVTVKLGSWWVLRIKAVDDFEAKLASFISNFWRGAFGVSTARARRYNSVDV